MPWHRVDEISEYRLNTRKLDAWLKSKWGNYDYQIQVHCIPFVCRTVISGILMPSAKVRQRPLLLLVLGT